MQSKAKPVARHDKQVMVRLDEQTFLYLGRVAKEADRPLGYVARQLIERGLSNDAGRGKRADREAVA